MGKPRDGGASAIWERDIIITFCDLCVREVELGNRPTTFFNKEGWQNILAKFIERSGREYSKIQLKNKWDQLKKDWKLWKELKRGSTGLGWDPKKKTIDASDEWWKEKLQVVPNAKKFRYAGIDQELEAKLDVMFDGVVATGDHSWAPTEDANEVVNEVDETQEKESTNDLAEESINCLNEHVESSHSKRASNPLSRAGKKKKGGATFLQSQISELVTACSSLRASRAETTEKTPSLSRAIQELDLISDIYDDKDLYVYSIQLLKDVEQREIFLAMLPERRAFYLRHQFSSCDD